MKERKKDERGLAETVTGTVGTSEEQKKNKGYQFTVFFDR